MTTLLALLTSLPTGNSTVRMRVWRGLKTSGCGVLRDGVYILPIDSPRNAALRDAESEIKAAGGFAMTVELNLKGPEQLDHVRTLFDRSKEYGALVARISATRSALRRLGKRQTSTLVQRLQRSLQELIEVDFYPGEANSQAKDAMSALERDAQALFSAGEPHSARKKVRRQDPVKYRNRVWATRKDLWVDRMASAWLIKRFIDTKAKFAWLDHPRVRPEGAIGFDFDGAEFTHVDSLVTFEVLVASFGLGEDQALASLGQAVHFLDTGGIPVGDATGLETILRGVKGKARDDDAVLIEASKVFDLFYSAYSQKSAA